MTTAGGKSCMRQREGWSWDDGDEEYHGHGGHQILLHHTPAARAFLEAGKEKRWSTMDATKWESASLRIPSGMTDVGAQLELSSSSDCGDWKICLVLDGDAAVGVMWKIQNSLVRE